MTYPDGPLLRERMRANAAKAAEAKARADLIETALKAPSLSGWRKFWLRCSLADQRAKQRIAERRAQKAKHRLMGMVI